MTIRFLLKTGLLALLYAITGKLGFALGIPPGYATAIFPPAGLALAALLLFGSRMLVGIWLGSALLNLWVAYDNFGPLTIFAATTAAIIATGAMLQAWVGGWLIRRFCTDPWEFDGGRAVGKFLP